MSTPAGWYPNGEEWETYWDGNAWTDQNRPRGGGSAVESKDAVDELQAGDGVHSPLLDFTSHIEGKNARVQVWLDRVGWNWQSRLGDSSHGARTENRAARRAIRCGYARWRFVFACVRSRRL